MHGSYGLHKPMEVRGDRYASSEVAWKEASQAIDIGHKMAEGDEQ